MNPQYQFDHRLRSQCVDLAAGSSVLNEQIFLVKLLTADTARKLWAVEVGHSMSSHMCMSWFYFNLCSPVNLAHVMKVSQNECCTTVQKRNVKLIEETGGEPGRSENRESEEEALTFPCQLAVVWLFAGYYLLHQLVVTAVAHCLDNVMHLQTDIKTVGKNIHHALLQIYLKCITERKILVTRVSYWYYDRCVNFRFKYNATELWCN